MGGEKSFDGPLPYQAAVSQVVYLTIDREIVHRQVHDLTYCWHRAQQRTAMREGGALLG